jgi:hypothetical protein
MKARIRVPSQDQDLAFCPGCGLCECAKEFIGINAERHLARMSDTPRIATEFEHGRAAEDAVKPFRQGRRPGVSARVHHHLS